MLSAAARSSLRASSPATPAVWKPPVKVCRCGIWRLATAQMEPESIPPER